jgi:hypothetical protein
MKKSVILILFISFCSILSSCQTNKDNIDIRDSEKTLTVPLISDSDIVKRTN